MKALIKKQIKLLIPLFAAVLMLVYNGCDKVQDVAVTDNLDMSAMATTDSTDNIGTLVITSVKMIIKDIKLNVANSSDSSNFTVGMRVLYLDLNSSVNILSTGFIPAGTYDKVMFRIHKLEGNETPPDPEFVDPNGRYSLIVKGTFNGINFVYKSDKSAHQKLTFQSHLQTSLSGKSNITLCVKPYIWFISNGVYLDPMDINNRNDIDNNIKANINNNFKIFVDNDRNGQPD
jgi:hypothetical protein